MQARCGASALMGTLPGPHHLGKHTRCTPGTWFIFRLGPHTTGMSGQGSGWERGPASVQCASLWAQTVLAVAGWAERMAHLLLSQVGGQGGLGCCGPALPGPGPGPLPRPWQHLPMALRWSLPP